MVKALASHQCGPGSIPRLAVRCGLTLICCWFSSSSSISEFQFDLDTVDEEPPFRCATANSFFKFFLKYLFSFSLFVCLTVTISDFFVCYLFVDVVDMVSTIIFDFSGVDLMIWAHEHSYERLYPVYNRTVRLRSD